MTDIAYAARGADALCTAWTSLLLAALPVTSLTVGCSNDTYVIGALCTAVGTCPGGGSAGSAGNGAGGASGGPDAGTLPDAGLGGQGPMVGVSLDLSGSGVARLPVTLFGTAPTHWLIADDATMVTWDARVGDGFDVMAPTALELGQPSPFADPEDVLAHSGLATFTADSRWADTSAGSFALEAVFRGEPGAVLLQQGDQATGLEWSLDLEGRLNLRLAANGALVVASSSALVPDAWHHCLALYDASHGVAQVFCNGQAGVAATVPASFVLAVPTAPAVLGADNAARLHWAQLARWQAPTWGPRGAWTDAARERFARLVGTYAAGSSDPLPFEEVRASGAYVDMTSSDAPEQRRLHPVGEDWPRIVCRPAGETARVCGLLVEAASSQPLAPEAFNLDNWEPSGVSVAASGLLGPTGAATLFALTAGASATEHRLELDVPLGDGPAVFSFFGRAGSSPLVRAEVVGLANATFDVAQGVVVDSTGTLLATAEPWGGGLMRFSLSFDVEAGPARLALALLAADGAEAFPGDGSVGAHLGHVDLHFRSVSTPLPTFGAIQQADHLAYPVGTSNLPSGPWFAFSAEVWLPDAPLIADAAIFNANFAAQGNQQINLFVRPTDGTVQFWGLQGNATHWQFSNEAVVTDGSLHQVAAEVGPAGATLSVDGQAVTVPAGAYDLSVLDRLEIGTSTNSSGPFTGLLRQVRIAPE